MGDQYRSLTKVFFTAATIIGLTALVAVLIYSGNSGNVNPTQLVIEKKLEREEETFKQLEFTLVDPNDAPDSIKELASLGFEAMVDTRKLAPENVGNKLSCTNCHFAGGNTTGGPQGGIALAGVATKYPNFDKRLDKVIDLEARINNCFLKSMNGKPLEHDSKLMLAFVTYFQWISKNLPIYMPVPWLSLQPLHSQHTGNPVKGKKIFETYCSLCHQEKFRGKIFPPPLWGDDSFNDAAGMSFVPKLSAFIYWNMPYNDSTPVLTEEEAIDVASYILTKPRPHYDPNKWAKEENSN